VWRFKKYCFYPIVFVYRRIGAFFCEYLLQIVDTKECTSHIEAGGHTFLYVMRYVLILLAHLWKKTSHSLHCMR
jgi:hypothetical protein